MCRKVVLVDSDVQENPPSFYKHAKSWFQRLKKDEINAEDCTDLVSELESGLLSDVCKTFLSYLKLTQREASRTGKKAQGTKASSISHRIMRQKRNLELTTTIRANQKTWVIVLVLRCMMGGRSMAWKPLCIRRLFKTPCVRVEITESTLLWAYRFLSKHWNVCIDLERIVVVSFGTANARDSTVIKTNTGTSTTLIDCR